MLLYRVRWSDYFQCNNWNASLSRNEIVQVVAWDERSLINGTGEARDQFVIRAEQNNFIFLHLAMMRWRNEQKVKVRK